MANETIREKIRKDLKKRVEKDFIQYSDDYKFYYKNYNDNLIGGPMDPNHIEMFNQGSGSELIDEPAKAKAIDSSSMLSYNFFRKIGNKTPLTINDIVYDKVFFEVRMRTLSSRSNPANMDVVLLSQDSKYVLFIESKFLEFLDTGSANLSDSYVKQESYYNNKDTDLLVKMAETYKNERGRYNYGIKQNICHLISISNLQNSDDARKWFYNEYKDKAQALIIDGKKKFKFMNLIFEPLDNDAHKKYDHYIKALNEFKNNLDDTIKQYINEPHFIMNYRELFDCLTYDDDYKNKLNNKYLEVHK